VSTTLARMEQPVGMKSTHTTASAMKVTQEKTVRQVCIAIVSHFQNENCCV